MLSVRAIGRTAFSTGALGALLLAGAPGAVQAQTAQQYNQAAAAIQMCASPAAAAIPQCAQLNQQLGVAAGANTNANANAGASVAGALLNGLAGNKSGGAGGLAGILGAVAGQAAQASAPAAPPAPAYGTGDYHNQAAAATYNAGVEYRACVMANPTNWQPCLAHMNGGAPVNVAGAAPAAAPGINLTGAALAGYQTCLSNNPAEKCAQAYGVGASTAAAAPAPADGANAIATAASVAQTAKSLAPTLKAWGSLLGR